MLMLAGGEVRANPHVWVRAAMTFSFADGRVDSVTFSWTFDHFYSAHGIGTYDTDRDGVLNAVEVERLRVETFDPLADADYHVHFWTGGQRLDLPGADRFAARIDDRYLVYEFSLPVTPTVDPKTDTVSVNLHDPKTRVDFRLADSSFLLVQGTMPDDCRFRIRRGAAALSGGTRSVTLDCGG